MYLVTLYSWIYGFLLIKVHLGIFFGVVFFPIYERRKVWFCPLVGKHSRVF